MLVLSRKVGERLIIGDGIELTISRIAGNRVAIGIVAPKEVPILRGELAEAMEHDQETLVTIPMEQGVAAQRGAQTMRQAVAALAARKSG